MATFTIEVIFLELELSSNNLQGNWIFTFYPNVNTIKKMASQSVKRSSQLSIYLTIPIAINP